MSVWFEVLSVPEFGNSVLPASGYQVQRDQLPVTITYIASNALAVA